MSKDEQADACMLLMHMVRECVSSSMQDCDALTSIVQEMLHQYNLAVDRHA